MTDPSPWNSIHLIADLDARRGLDDLELIERVLRDAAAVAGATLIDIRLHHFGTGMGVTGVAILAESHISIHGWPENDFAAIDIFMCGARCQPDAALNLIVERLDATIRSAQRIVRAALTGSSQI